MCNQFTEGTAGPEQDFNARKDIKCCKLSCCNRCTFCARALPKERVKSRGSRLSNNKVSQIKVCESCFLCHSIVLCPKCKQCPKCCTKSACWGQTPKIWGNLAKSGSRSENYSNTEGRLCPSLPDPAKSYKVSNSHKLLCQSPQEQLPAGGIASAYRQKCSRTGPQSNIFGFLQPTVPSSKTQQQMEANTRPEQTELLSKGGEVQNGDSGNHQNVPSRRGVGHFSRFQRRLLPHTNTGTIQETPKISRPGSDLPIQGSVPFGLSTAPMEFTVLVHLGRLHMRPIQWHLKNNWRIPESLEKIIPLPRSLHPHLQWWLEENNVLQGQPLHPIRHALQIFTDASKEGWGAHLKKFTARGSWSVPESKLHINYLELKAVFLALKEFQNLCVNKIVLVATDNTTVVAYINKKEA